jgi:crotonobetainyl-CoA:carnitine CoA-transferase CaiB-like acyl-CoA transferase
VTATPLHGLRVVDFTRILAGPLCTMILGDLGADVIKVERPGSGDDTRSWGPPFRNGDAAYFLAVNRNKRSITLDLADAGDVAVAKELISHADVVIENFRTGVIERFGLGYDTVRTLNPRVVYCSIPAFSDETLGQMPGYDLVMQAYSGFMSITGEETSEPVKVGVAVLDVIAGLYAAIGIQAALRSRDLTGVGDKVTVGLFDASVAALVNQAANYLIGEMLPRRSGNAHPSIVPYEVFPTGDRPLALAAGNDKLFRISCDVLGVPGLAAEPRFRTNATRVEHRDELVHLMAQEFRRRPLEHWLAALRDHGVPCGPVRSIDEVFRSPEGHALIQQIDDPERGPLRLVASPVRFGDHQAAADASSASDVRPPPVLGEHGAEVRAELDVRRSADDDDIGAGEGGVG